MVSPAMKRRAKPSSARMPCFDAMRFTNALCARRWKTALEGRWSTAPGLAGQCVRPEGDANACSIERV